MIWHYPIFYDDYCSDYSSNKAISAPPLPCKCDIAIIDYLVHNILPTAAVQLVYLQLVLSDKHHYLSAHPQDLAPGWIRKIPSETKLEN